MKLKEWSGLGKAEHLRELGGGREAGRVGGRDRRADCKHLQLPHALGALSHALNPKASTMQWELAVTRFQSPEYLQCSELL